MTKLLAIVTVVMTLAVLLVVIAVMVMIFCLQALGPSALAGDSTAWVAVVAAAIVKIPELDQGVFDQPIEGMTPSDRSAQVRNAVTNCRPWMLGHVVFLSNGPCS